MDSDKSIFNPPSDEDEQGKFMSKEHKAEFQKIKMKDKSANAAPKVMHVKLKRVLASHDKGLKEQIAVQSRKHAAELEALKQSQMATKNLDAQKATPQLHDCKVAAHFESMTQASYALFERKSENWPTFENHLI
jgi:hypothetical protein